MADDHGPGWTAQWHLAARRRRYREPARSVSDIGAPAAESALPVEAAQQTPPVVALGLQCFRRAAARHPVLADRHRAALPRAGAARRSRDATASAGGTADRPARRGQGRAGRCGQARSADPSRLHRHRGPPLPQPLGHRPARHRPGDGRQRPGGRRAPGRQHADPAAGQDQLPVLRPFAEAQGAGSDHRLLAGRLADQGRDPLPLSVERSISATASMACALRRATISTGSRSG